MSVTQLLQAIDSLPDQERAEFFRLLNAKRSSNPLVSKAGKKATSQRAKASHVKWEDLSQWRVQVFGSKVSPNPVLLEREESRY
jgi:hypothetical protein